MRSKPNEWLDSDLLFGSDEDIECQLQEALHEQLVIIERLKRENERATND